MSCSKCKNQYCWVCLDKWESSHYSCTNHSASNSGDERDHLLRRIDANLTFNQYYMIHLKARRVTDIDFKTKCMNLTKSLIFDKKDFKDTDIELICKALEFLFLARHIILHVCILGKYMSENKMKGSKALKNEIRRLSVSLSFQQSSLDVTAKTFKPLDVELGITGINTAVREFVKVLSNIIRQKG